jgi:E3 ubiquitin-protein ligase XBAT32/33
VLDKVAARGFAAEVYHCRFLCGRTWRAGAPGGTSDVLVRSVEAQCKARAARSAEREVVTQLGNLEVRGSTQLMRAAMLNNLPRVLRLVQLGAPLNVVDKSEGYSALHWASRSSKNESIAKALLDGKYSGRGASVDQRGKNGWTPLMLASSFGHADVVRILLARGAKQQLQSPNGLTPLHLAVMSNLSDIVELLCADPSANAAWAVRSSSGRTPLAVAVERGHAACAAVLREHGAES